MLSFLFQPISILRVGLTHSSLFSPPSDFSDQTHSLPFHVSSQGPWVLQWCIPVPQHSGQGWHPPYISLKEIYWQQISVSPLHCSPVDFSSRSFSVCILLFFSPNPVKWPYQVLRYVSDAATHAPTLRFGKEMSTKSRLQGRPYSLSTFFPVQKQRFSQWRALQCSLFVLCFATVLIPFWCKLQSYVPCLYCFVQLAACVSWCCSVVV